MKWFVQSENAYKNILGTFLISNVQVSISGCGRGFSQMTCNSESLVKKHCIPTGHSDFWASTNSV
jgi:hypothetical protein